MKAKVFDCVAMKRKASLRIHDETKNLTFEEELEYWHQKNEEMLRRQAQRLRQHEKSGKG
ncbi:hypothetical protein AMJ85_05530 [candidate division BRC1 bacterium SM23_51]|nr:MAG: hypothetical protein AMJ85_05530 [candidate division BRC1 bacterium SM23_51]